MEFFSPIQVVQLPCGTSISVKRDDLIDPFISGNKWRKLKYILQDAVQTHKTHLVTFGGAYSNHLVATAAAAAKFRLSATAFIRGEEVRNEMLTICKLYGMQLIFVDRESYRNKKRLFDTHFSGQEEAYFIDEGGASEAAVKGCSEIIEELPNQFDHIFCAAGTGTTAAGLLRGLNVRQQATRLHVIPVLKGADYLSETIQGYEGDIGLLNLHFDYHFGGYAKTSSLLIDFIKEFSATTGILADPVYTGKMFFAINDLISKGEINANDKILAIHTGGLLGILGMKDKF